MTISRNDGRATPDARGVTGPRRRAAQPDSAFAASQEEGDLEGRTRITFFGDDGREAAFDLDRIALPGWVTPMGSSFAARTGPAGELRTLASARGSWIGLLHFTDYLSALPDPPADPSQLRRAQLEAYHRLLLAQGAERGAWGRFRQVRALLHGPGVRDLLTPDVAGYLAVRVSRASGGDKPGYTDGELHRLTTRLRDLAAGIRDRIEAGQRLAVQFQQGLTEIPPADRALAEQLATIAATGVVPHVGHQSATTFIPRRLALARHLFMTASDITTLTALFVAVSGRNLETIKELPATGRIIDGRAVELTVTKRRRGRNNWFEAVAWEIGPSGRELHHPGGLFLMVQRLTALSRRFSDAERLWASWRNGHRTGVLGTAAEHYDAFADNLHLTYYPSNWSAAQKDLWADPVPGQDERAPLQLDCMRLKKSIDIRRTKQMGGHLPSAARSNTYPVLFSNYLRADPTARQWAEDVVSEALADAEQAAWQAHRKGLERHGGQLRVLPGEPTAERLEQAGLDAGAAAGVAAGEHDTAYAACTDSDHHPDTGRSCQTPSLLDCFHCGNCVITRDHLPRLLALLEALNQRRRQLSEHEWWRRYGPTWVAIRRDIIDGRHFTPAEIETARRHQPADALLDLVERPWEGTE